MSAWLVYFSLMGLTVSYRHAWRRNLSSGLGLPFPRMMARRPFRLERDFDWLQWWPMRTQENQQIICCLCSPLFPRYQQMLIYRQYRTGKRFIHHPSPPDIMSLAGNCNSVRTTMQGHDRSRHKPKLCIEKITCPWNWALHPDRYGARQICLSHHAVQTDIQAYDSASFCLCHFLDQCVSPINTWCRTIRHKRSRTTYPWKHSKIQKRFSASSQGNMSKCIKKMNLKTQLILTGLSAQSP